MGGQREERKHQGEEEREGEGLHRHGSRGLSIKKIGLFTCYAISLLFSFSIHEVLTIIFEFMGASGVWL